MAISPLERVPMKSSHLSTVTPVPEFDPGIVTGIRVLPTFVKQRVPIAYASMLYMLRLHIDLVRTGLKRHVDKAA
jgi:hypothetical protein